MVSLLTIANALSFIKCLLFIYSSKFVDIKKSAIPFITAGDKYSPIFK